MGVKFCNEMSSDDDFYCNESQDSGNCSPMYSSDESFDADDSPNKKQKKEDWQPKILTAQDCVPMMEAIIDDVKSVIDTPKTIIRVLMNLCKWDKQNVWNNFFLTTKENSFLT